MRPRKLVVRLISVKKSRFEEKCWQINSKRLCVHVGGSNRNRFKVQKKKDKRRCAHKTWVLYVIMLKLLIHKVIINCRLKNGYKMISCFILEKTDRIFRISFCFRENALKEFHEWDENIQGTHQAYPMGEKKAKRTNVGEFRKSGFCVCV